MIEIETGPLTIMHSANDVCVLQMFLAVTNLVLANKKEQQQRIQATGETVRLSGGKKEGKKKKGCC